MPPVNSGGIDSGAQLGIVHTLPTNAPSPHPARTVKWKKSDETYRRLVESYYGSLAAQSHFNPTTMRSTGSAM